MDNKENNTSLIRTWKEQANESDEVKCDHDCRISCRMLSAAMRKEAEIIGFYEKLVAECDYPDVNSFVRKLLEEKGRTVLQINQKLNEIRVCGQVSREIISSSEPDS